MDFTICIPTYNRNDLLKNSVKHLIECIGDKCKIIIIDNCSDIEVVETLGSLKSENENTLKIIRNRLNIGGAANMLRCMEVCTTRWMLCLGDDDVLESNFVGVVRENIEKYNDSLFINFRRPKSTKKQNTDKLVNGLNNFVVSLDDWSSLLFMSTSLVNVELLSPCIRWGYLYAYSWAPFQAILIKTLNSGGYLVYSQDTVCREESLAKNIWIPFPVLAGKMVLPELVDDEKLRKQLALSLMNQPPPIASIYWARILSKTRFELNQNKMFIRIFLSRGSRYTGLMSCLYLGVIAEILLSDWLVSDKTFSIIEKLVFKIIGRQIPARINVDVDRV